MDLHALHRRAQSDPELRKELRYCYDNDIDPLEHLADLSRMEPPPSEPPMRPPHGAGPVLRTRRLMHLQSPAPKRLHRL